jgi:hypothetical protein
MRGLVCERVGTRCGRTKCGSGAPAGRRVSGVRTLDLERGGALQAKHAREAVGGGGGGGGERARGPARGECDLGRGHPSQ